MRAIMQYLFRVGTKVSFLTWPDIIQSYLEQLNLHYEAFGYYFDTSYSNRRELALKELPGLGPLRIDDSNPKNPNGCFTNLQDGTGLSEEDILSHLPAIYRRYSFADTYLIYQNVDFFSRHTSLLLCDGNNLPARLRGSQIILHRDSVFSRWNCICLSVDVLHEGSILDASPYRDAMTKLLPGIPNKERMICLLTPEEQAQYAVLSQNAAPLVQNISSYFSEQMTSSQDADIEFGRKLSLAAILKRLCRQYGYTYLRYEYFCFFMQKRTENGHYIRLDVDIGKYSQEANLAISFTGLGFDHRLFYIGTTPETQTEAAEYLSQWFSVLSAAEKDVFPALDAHYPPTPEWFVPVS